MVSYDTLANYNKVGTVNSEVFYLLNPKEAFIKGFLRVLVFPRKVMVSDKLPKNEINQLEIST